MRSQRSSGNVFRDLGFADDEAENLRVRADLMIGLAHLIEQQGLTQAEAARVLGVTQPRVNALLRGKIHLFSVDGLMKMIGRTGNHVSVTIKSPQGRVA